MTMMKLLLQCTNQCHRVQLLKWEIFLSIQTEVQIVLSTCQDSGVKSGDIKNAHD